MENHDLEKKFIRLDFLDALRGFAIAYILLYHAVQIPSPSLMPLLGNLKPFFTQGWTGVTLFFMVSGFSLSYSMERRINEEKTIRNFYIRRFFRIAPLFYLMMIVTITRDFLLFNSVHNLKEMSVSILFIFNFFPGYQEGIVWSSWTIGVEIICYLLFPILYKYTKTTLSLLLLFFSAITISKIYKFFIFQIWDNFEIQSVTVEKFFLLSFLHQLPVFIGGMVCFHIYKKISSIQSNKKKKNIGISFVTFSLFIFTLLMADKLKILSPDYGNWEIPVVVYGLLIIGLAFFPAKFLINNFFIKTGKLSYSIYLIHPITILMLSRIPIIPNILGKSAFIGNEVKVILFFSLNLILATFISYFSYKFVEKKGIALGEYLINALGPKNIQQQK